MVNSIKHLRYILEAIEIYSENLYASLRYLQPVFQYISTIIIIIIKKKIMMLQIDIYTTVTHLNL